jgi:hypothetical protein
LPTALALDRGAAANQPLALAVVGGLTSSMVLSAHRDGGALDGNPPAAVAQDEP